MLVVSGGNIEKFNFNGQIHFASQKIDTSHLKEDILEGHIKRVEDMLRYQVMSHIEILTPGYFNITHERNSALRFINITVSWTPITHVT